MVPATPAHMGWMDEMRWGEMGEMESTDGQAGIGGGDIGLLLGGYAGQPATDVSGGLGLEEVVGRHGGAVEKGEWSLAI